MPRWAAIHSKLGQEIMLPHEAMMQRCGAASKAAGSTIVSSLGRSRPEESGRGRQSACATMPIHFKMEMLFLDGSLFQNYIGGTIRSNSLFRLIHRKRVETIARAHQ